VPEILTQVLAILFLVLIATAAIAAFTIAARQRSSKPAAVDRAQLAAELIQLEEELNYAEAFAADDSNTTANLARAHNELNLAFLAYNKASAVSGEALSTADGNEIRARIATVRDILANPEAPIAGAVTNAAPALIVDNQLAPVIGNGSRVFEVALWVLGIIPGAVLAYQKGKARNYFTALDQRIKTNAAQIDVYLAERLQILRSCAAYAPGLDLSFVGEGRNVTNGRIDGAYQELIERAKTNPALQTELKSALRSDRTVQREITAARTLYNDTVNMWNADIFAWPAKMMVATDAGLTTRPVFVASQLAPTVDLIGSR